MAENFIKLGDALERVIMLAKAGSAFDHDDECIKVVEDWVVNNLEEDD